MSLPQLNWLQVSSDSYGLRKHLIYLDLNLFVVWLPTEILWKLGTHLWVAIQRPRHQNKTREIWSEFHAVCCRRKYKVTETWPGLSAAAQARLFLIRTGTWQCKKKKKVCLSPNQQLVCNNWPRGGSKPSLFQALRCYQFLATTFRGREVCSHVFETIANTRFLVYDLLCMSLWHRSLSFLTCLNVPNRIIQSHISPYSQHWASYQS